jgi:ribosomal protein L11
MKITKSELKQIIKEEALKFKKKLQLESQLAEVEKELEEVTAGNMHELPDGTKKWKPEFEELSKDGGYPALKEEDESCEEGEEPLNEVLVTAALAGVAALVGGSVGLAVLETKAEEAAKGKIEDKPLYKAFRKIQKAATGISAIKKGANEGTEMHENEEMDLEKAAEVAEENPETAEAKEMATAMKELEAAAKEMSDEEKAELKAECSAMEESMACEEDQTLEEMLAEIMAEEDEPCEEGEEPLNEVAVLAVLAGIGALVGGSVGLASLEMKAEEAAKGKIEDKPIYKAFRKIQQAATGMSAIKKGNMYEGEELDLEKAAEVAEENPETAEAKEMAAAMKELEAAAKEMSDEEKAELKTETQNCEEEEVVAESIDNSKSVLTEEQNRMKQLAGLL